VVVEVGVEGPVGFPPVEVAGELWLLAPQLEVDAVGVRPLLELKAQLVLRRPLVLLP
jgi:hypothetical protein